MPTAQALINKSAKKLLVIEAGESLSASESADCLEFLNDLVGTWNAEETMATATTIATVAMSGASSYTLATRVPKVAAASHTFNGATLPVEVVGVLAWSNIIDRDISGNFARKLFYDRGGSSGVIYLSPRPASGTLNLMTWAAQSSFALLSTNNTLLPGYEEALTNALAIGPMAAYFGRKPDDALTLSYKTSMDWIQKRNKELWDELAAAAA